MKEEYKIKYKKEIDILENYAKLLDRYIDIDKREENFDFDEFFSFIETIQKSDIPDEAVVKSYASYLYGAALPMYEELKETDCSLSFSELIPVNLLTVIEWKEFGNESPALMKYCSDRLKNYMTGHKDNWAVMFGFSHYWYIKKHRDKTGDISPYWKK